MEDCDLCIWDTYRSNSLPPKSNEPMYSSGCYLIIQASSDQKVIHYHWYNDLQFLICAFLSDTSQRCSCSGTIAFSCLVVHTSFNISILCTIMMCGTMVLIFTPFRQLKNEEQSSYMYAMLHIHVYIYGTYMYTYMRIPTLHLHAAHTQHTHTHTHACDCINHCAGMPSSYTIANTDLYICISHKSHAFSISTTLSSVLAFWECGRCGDNMFKVVLYHSQTSPYQPPPTNWVLDCIMHGGKDPLIATLTEKVWSLQHSQVLNCKILRYQTMMTITSHTCCV